MPARPETSAGARDEGGRLAPLHLALFGVAYVLAGGFGQGLALIPGVSITFWPPAGIFLAALLLSPRRRWPALVLCAGAAELLCNALWFHNPLPFALLYFGANAIEALLGAWLIGRALRRPLRLDSFEEFGAFLCLGAAAAPLAGAMLIATVDALRGKHAFWSAWTLVWLGDSTGLLVSAPLALLTVQALRARARIPPRRFAEAVAVAAMLCAVCALALRGWLPTVYMCMPLLLWAAVRFQLRGAAAALGLVVLMTALSTMRGAGEFAGRPEVLRDKIVMLQAFLGISAVSALLVGVLSLQLRQALASVQSMNAELESRVAARTGELARSEAQLREADRRKDEFLATLGHELRNPLAPLRNAAQLLAQGAGARGELRRPLDMIERQVQAMARLIDDLLDVSRVNQGKLVLRRERVELAAVIQAALEASRPHIERMGHELTVTLPAAPLILDGDATRLTQVFLNLLNNGAKYMERGGRLALCAAQTGDAVVVSVRDEGIGLAPEQLTRIFELFSQVEGALARSQGGLGVGLHLVRRLVELHGGEVFARSEGLGRGSEFTVRLPIAAGPAPAAEIGSEPAGATTAEPTAEIGSEAAGATTAEPAAEPAAPEPPPPLRILVVDDNRDAAESAGMVLSAMGHDVHLAHDGEEALAAAAALRPRVVLCDIGLPRHSGYEVCQLIRQEPWGRDMLLIAVTGWGQEGDRRNARDAGFDHHMVKPVDLQALGQLLAELAAPAAAGGTI